MAGEGRRGQRHAPLAQPQVFDPPGGAEARATSPCRRRPARRGSNVVSSRSSTYDTEGGSAAGSCAPAKDPYRLRSPSRKSSSAARRARCAAAPSNSPRDSVALREDRASPCAPRRGRARTRRDREVTRPRVRMRADASPSDRGTAGRMDDQEELQQDVATPLKVGRTDPSARAHRRHVQPRVSRPVHLLRGR